MTEIIEFSLEKISEKIHNRNTKYYFEEVLSSYQNGNYCSAVVMLWSVVVCDIVYKLKDLKDLYEDSSAKKILEDMEKMQEDNPKSSEWEIKIIEKTHKNTNLIDQAEYQNLEYLQKQRHLSAHPVFNQENKLYTPNKETVRSLLRNTLEDLLIKPPFYAQKIEELLKDISENKSLLDKEEKLEKFIESRYLSRLKPEIQISIFRLLWKFVFRLENEDCEKNRKINFWTLNIISKKNVNRLQEIINNEKDYYSKVASSGTPLFYLVLYLSTNKDLYNLLKDDAHIQIKYFIETCNDVKYCNDVKLFGWFIKDSLETHFDVYTQIKKIFDDKDDKFDFSSYPNFNVERLIKSNEN